MPSTLSLSDALNALLRHPVLVIGSGATSYLTALQDLSRKIRESVDVSSDLGANTDHYDLVDSIKASAPEQLTEVQSIVHNHFKTLPRTPHVEALAQGRWSAIVSLTSDLLLEESLRLRFDRVPSTWALTVVDHPSVVPPAQTTPVYKLLGNLGDARPDRTLATSKSDLLKRKQTWGRLLSTLPDFAANAPYLFIGTETSVDVARDFLGVLYAKDPPYPRRLLFFKGDGTIHDPTMLSLAIGHSEVAIVDCSLKQFCDATTSMTPTRCFVSGSAPVPASRDP